MSLIISLKKIFNYKSLTLLLLVTVFILIIIVVGFFVSNIKIYRDFNHTRDITSYSYIKFYSLIRENQLNFDFSLEQLDNKTLSKQDKEKLEKICSFHVEDGIDRLEVAKGYDCLLRLYANENSTLVEIYKAIKNGSYGLDVIYTERGAINLVKLIVKGYEKEVKELLGLASDLDFTKYYTGYAKDEIPFLNSLISLDIPPLTAKCLYRLSLIHLFGRASFNEEIPDPNYMLAMEELQKTIKTTKIKQDNVLDIALIINDKFASHAGVVIASALLNSDLDSFYKFHIVMNPKDQVSTESKAKLSAMQYIKNYSIDFINFPENLITKDLIQEKVKFPSNWPSLVIYRLYFDQIFPDLDSILYLDADIIVLHDLNSLKKIDMDNYIAAGVMDLSLVHCKSNINLKCHKNMINSYKNSGVIFFNLENMKKKKAGAFLSKTLNDSECKFPFPDQDLFNVAFCNYIYPLPIRWNFSTYFDDVNPYFSYFIAHYAGPKPWTPKIQELWKTNRDKLSKNVKNYWQYREITPWKDISI